MNGVCIDEIDRNMVNTGLRATFTYMWVSEDEGAQVVVGVGSLWIIPEGDFL